MKALLLIPGQEPTPCPRVPCLSLFPLLDRPFVQHVVEAIARRGIREIMIVHGPGSQAIKQFLGDGTRWGCSFSYHAINDPERPEAELRTVVPSDGPILIGRADQLPAIPTVIRVTPPGLLYGTANNWSGWAVVSSQELANLPPDASLGEYLAARRLQWVDVGQPIVLRTLADVQAAQRALLLVRFPGAMIAAHETDPGIWIGRNVQLDPGAKLQSPVFIGDNTVVAGGARVGPGAVVGANCMLSRDSYVHETTVCPGTFVGSGVELDGVIVDGRSLVNPVQQTVATVDRRWLDRLAPGIPNAGLTLLVAGVACVCALPVITATYLWRRLTRTIPPSDSAEGMKSVVAGDRT